MGNTWLWIGIVIVGYFIIKGMIHDNKVEKSSTRTCASCGMKIPYNSNVCPYCRRSPGHDFGAFFRVGRKSSDGIFTRIMLLLLLLLVAFVLVYGMISGDFSIGDILSKFQNLGK